MKNFKDKVVIVTGAASGIGKCIAEEFLSSGAKVVAIDKDECSLNLDFFYRGDITEESVIVDFSQKVIDKYGKIDYIINNAGLTKGGLKTCNYENFLYVQKLSLAAPFMLTKLFLNNFNANAAIVNIASTRAFQSQEDWESYAAAKGGIVALTHSMAVTLRGAVRVNCVSPGWIDTVESYLSQEDKSQHPIGRVGKPTDIANAVMYLCSDKSGFITGENIVIDGGMSKLMIYHNDFGWEYKV